ncbi:heparinase II/III domain-containing protein [Chelativorans salis]|uniref:Heparinase II/III family protein n=1 Tax=Chelativorans salis TaxID=2978478 RepID=A0ABT2LUK1_9HYPH|nr:heparinase II/III family protein [Chelativorans sp. EGI FJ00035]MCT7378210.1 heparinase II/III family protein [Chelativorans sp. EGI FJ00035]
MKGFPSEEIDLRQFRWAGLTRDRNWWWQLQALPFLDWFVGAYGLLATTNEKRQGFNFGKRALLNWQENAETNRAPLTWQDHASAFRLRNLVRWLSLAAICEFDLDDIEWLHLVERHLAFLADEKQYSRHTNHGFDQAFIGYQTCLMWSKIPRVAAFSETFRSRLHSEVEFAFTSQGVHKENSPGYQKGMTASLKSLSTFKALGDNEIGRAGEILYSRARNVLRAMTLPSGTLPMIGDTPRKLGLEDKAWPDVEVVDLADSGYVIARGMTIWGERYHLTFKCGHLSHYHRHDDDLSIHLAFEDQIVFGDAGLGHYDEKDAQRIAVRSPKGHTTVFPLGTAAARKPERLSQLPTLRLVDRDTIEGETSMYGGRLCRIVDLSCLRQGRITIRDRWKEPINAQTQTSFLLGANAEVKSTQGEAVAWLKVGTRVSITATPETQWAHENVPTSMEYGVYQTAQRVFVEYPSSLPTIEFTVRITPASRSGAA